MQLGSKRIHKVRTRGGNIKYRAMRLDSGNFSWGSEGVSISHFDGLIFASCATVVLCVTNCGRDQDISTLNVKLDCLILPRNSTFSSRV